MYFAECENYMIAVQYIRSIQLKKMLDENGGLIDVCILITHDGKQVDFVGKEGVALFNSAKSNITEWRTAQGA